MLTIAWTACSLAVAQELAGCPILPKNNIWNTAVDRLPLHPSSAAFVASVGLSLNLHPDFGRSCCIPFTIVPADQKMVPIDFTHPENSEPGPYPIPDNVAREAQVDSHAAVLQEGTCKLYELYALRTGPNNRWVADSGAVFDLRSNALRPDGWTSADAAGLPILPGLVRWDEIAAGEIKHAIRVTAPRTRNRYVWPGRHFASRLDDPALPAMGQRFRLRGSFDISGFDPQVQVLLRALKQYGMILADNGQSWFLTGAPNENWGTELWSQIKRVKGSDIEAVDVSSLMLSPNSGQAGVISTVGFQEVAFSGAPAFDGQAGSAFSLTLSGDVVSPTLVNLNQGAAVFFLICQDATGGHQFAWPSNVSGGMSVGLEANACSAQTFVAGPHGLYASSPGVSNLARLK